MVESVLLLVLMLLELVLLELVPGRLGSESFQARLLHELPLMPPLVMRRLLIPLLGRAMTRTQPTRPHPDCSLLPQKQ